MIDCELVKSMDYTIPVQKIIIMWPAFAVCVPSVCVVVSGRDNYHKRSVNRDTDRKQVRCIKMLFI